MAKARHAHTRSRVTKATHRQEYGAYKWWKFKYFECGSEKGNGRERAAEIAKLRANAGDPIFFPVALRAATSVDRPEPRVGNAADQHRGPVGLRRF